MSMGTGTLDGFLVSMGGFGTHTNITLFLPTLGMKWNEMKWNEMKWNEMKWNEMKWNPTQPNPTQPKQPKSNRRFRKVLFVPLNREKTILNHDWKLINKKTI